jgi:hypothetical protein
MYIVHMYIHVMCTFTTCTHQIPDSSVEIIYSITNYMYTYMYVCNVCMYVYVCVHMYVYLPGI